MQKDLWRVYFVHHDFLNHILYDKKNECTLAYFIVLELYEFKQLYLTTKEPDTFSLSQTRK